MKKYFYIALAAIIVGLSITVAVEYRQLKNAEKNWKLAEANIKQYDSQLGYEKDRNSAFQLTIDQMKYFSDSVLKALDDTRKELDIKDKNLKALQQVSSSFTKKDTIYLDSVIFKELTFALDTIMGDKWYTLKLGLQYPSMIAVEPYFKSEKHIIVSSKKETVNPPKKFFLFRWFQRKHRVLHIDIKENNPYVDNESSKYIEIIK